MPTPPCHRGSLTTRTPATAGAQALEILELKTLQNDHQLERMCFLYSTPNSEILTNAKPGPDHGKDTQVGVL